MKDKKYIKDYQIIDGENKQGAKYIGAYFKFEDEGKIKKTKIILSILLFLSLILYVVVFFIKTTAGKTIYVILPYAISLIALFLSLLSLYDFLKIKGEFTRKQKEMSFERCAATSLSSLIILGISVVAAIVMLILKKEITISLDYIFVIIQLIQCAISYYSFCLCKNVAYQKIKEEEPPEKVNEYDDRVQDKNLNNQNKE